MQRRIVGLAFLALMLNGCASMFMPDAVVETWGTAPADGARMFNHAALNLCGGSFDVIEQKHGFRDKFPLIVIVDWRPYLAAGKSVENKYVVFWSASETCVQYHCERRKDGPDVGFDLRVPMMSFESGENDRILNRNGHNVVLVEVQPNADVKVTSTMMFEYSPNDRYQRLFGKLGFPSPVRP